MGFKQTFGCYNFRKYLGYGTLMIITLSLLPIKETARKSQEIQFRINNLDMFFTVEFDSL